MNLRILLFFVFISISFSNGYGQKLKTFSEDFPTFYTELEQFMIATKSPKKVEAFEAFGNANTLGKFDEPTQALIRNTADQMLKKGMSGSPYFTQYLHCLAAATNQMNADFKLKEWHGLLAEIMKNLDGRKFKPYIEFLKFSQGFFESGLIRKSKSGINWKAIHKGFEWKFEEGEPLLIFAKTDLRSLRKQDSIQILETSGKYFPNIGIWKGEGGKITWERHGYTEDVYCEIGKYEFEAKSSFYKVEGATLKYPTFLGQKTIKGTFEDKLIVGNKATGSSYPRFLSDDQRLKIDKIGKGIEFIGGFRFEGTTVYGYGSNEVPAQITINGDAGERKFKGLAEVFSIQKEEMIKASKVESTVYFDKDSIYHPSVSMRFEIPTKELDLRRGKTASDRGPFYSSMHKINFSTDNVICKLATDSIFLGKAGVQVAGTKESTVVFESIEYFREREFTKMQNIASYNPISIIRRAAQSEGRKIEANYLAKSFDPNFTVENIKGLLFQLVEEGFIDYDSDQEIVYVRDKIEHFTESNAEKKDYDYIKVTSKSLETNALLTTSDSKIQMNGVENVEFSPSQRVGLLPRNNELTMTYNRNMDFDGKMFAGFSSLIGKDMHFKYDAYHVEMDSVDYFDIFVPSGLIDEAKNEGEKAYSISSRIEDFKAVLLIDAPSNKSGKEDIDLFPSLASKGPSYVNYDKRNKQGSVYKRDSFHFELDPFSFNSLDKFTESDVTFAGNLNSAEIFPRFKESLVLMPQDSSLGFVTRTPPEGYPTFSAKGNFNGEIDLSNQGLLAKGTVKYLEAEINSEDIVFHPKLMTCTADKFDIDEVRNADPEFPSALGNKVSIEWRPYRDSMYIRSQEESFKMYRPEEHDLAGLLILTPGGLKGVGELDWDKANMSSDLFNFGAYSVTADTTDIKIKAFDADEYALSNSNLNADVDFDDQKGLFKANDEFLKTTLPYNQYQTTMNEFTWDMANSTIDFAALPGGLGTFTSIHPDQDSLFFKGESAFYNLKTNQLKIGGVPFIKSCDAFVYTETGDVEILPGGVMTTLNNAKIVCDTVNKNHTINRAIVDILGRKDYKATGYYEYNIGDKQQEIFFAEILGARVGKGDRSEKATETRASGAVEEGANFYIDLKTKFLGDIGLRSSSTALNFNGFAKLDTKTLPGSTWFSVQSEAAKEDLKIKFDVPKTMDGENLHTGLYLSKETALMYPRVLQSKFFRKDDAILPVEGLFEYDSIKDEFIFGDSAKVNKTSFQGNQIIFNNKSAKVRMEGKFNVCDSLKYLSVDVVGAATSGFAGVGDTVSGVPFNVNAEFLAGIDLKIPKKLYKFMIKDFKSAGFAGDPVLYSPKREFYKRALSELIPETSKEFAEVMAGINVGVFDLPKKMNDYSLFFSYLPMKWDVDYQSFITTEAKVGLYSINGEPVGQQVTAYVEFKMPTDDDDRLYVYLKSPSGYYYFFGFKQGVLNIVSDNMEFNDAVINLKKKESVIKMGKDEFFEIFPVEPSSANMFVRRIQAAAKGDK